MLLEAVGLEVGYGSVPVVSGIDLRVDAGQVVALLGANGAGKTTTLLALAGALPLEGGRIKLRGQTLAGGLHRRARAGVGLITENRGVFKQLTAHENLRVGGVDPEEFLALFPVLAPRLGVKAGLLSGGEQQMLAVGRALCRRPDLLIIDELSLGLAPLVVDQLLAVIRNRANEGAAVLVVEQHVRKVLAVADCGYVMQRGRVTTAGPAEDLLGRLDEIESAYFAISSPEATDHSMP